jgi:hypothetical protein
MRKLILVISYNIKTVYSINNYIISYLKKRQRFRRAALSKKNKNKLNCR